MLDLNSVGKLPVRDQADLYEDVVITMMLGDPKLILSLPVDLRWFRKWAKVVEVMLSLSSRGLEVSLVNVVTGLGAADVDGWYVTLGRMVKDYYTSVGYDFYLNKLREKYDDMRILLSLRESGKAIAEGRSSAREVLGGLVNESMAMLSTAEDRQDTFDAKQMVSAMVDRLAVVMDSKGVKHLGISTGVPKLDYVLGGLHPSDLCVVAARPGAGKTAFAIGVILHAAKAGLRVGFISSEMSVDQIAYRFSSQMSGIDANLYRRAQFDEQMLTRLVIDSKALSELSIRICDKTSVKVSEVALRCRAWAMDGGLDLVVVDYLQRIKPDKDSGNRNLDVGDIAIALKNLARDLNIPVVALAQLNRGNMNRGDKKPRMSDIRDSGIVEQEADSILLLHRDEDDTGNRYASVIIDKNRHGEAGVEASVGFDAKTMRWFSDPVGEDYE